MTLRENLAVSCNSREQLRRLLKHDGVLYAGPEQPIRHRDGSPAPWAFYSWGISLTAEGLHLAAVNLLERLGTFTSTQIAAHGYTSMPLLSACIALGGGRYQGLAVREKRKQYVSCRQVEGPIDRSKSVVVVDDSISSGTSLRRAILALEAEGLSVEGAVVLVNFPNRGGIEWATAAGYRVEPLFDVWRDLEMPATRSITTPPPSAPAHAAIVPNGLSPAAVARHAARYYLRHGSLPRPPEHLDGEYDARGGVFVSFRRKRDDHRIAREGFWHFDPRHRQLGADLIRATAQTIDASAGAIDEANLDSLKIGATLLGRLEAIAPSQLDFDTYGIVVRDRTFGTKLGGALPNTQVFISEIAQYTHARRRNARLGPIESHELFRHTVAKHVEAGAPWLPYGCPDGARMDWQGSHAIGRVMTARARHVALGTGLDRAIDAGTVPYPLQGVAVTLYRGGTLGSGIARGPGAIDELVCTAARLAARDPRVRATIESGQGDEIAVATSVLHDPEPFVDATLKLVTTKIRRGLDTVTLARGDRSATLLPGALVYNNWSKSDLTNALRARTGIAGPPWRWTTHRTTTWLESRGEVRRLRFGFPVRAAEGPIDRSGVEAEIARLGSFLFANLGPDDVPAYHVDPVSDTVTRRGTAPRMLHALVALDRAGALLARDQWRTAAQRGLLRYLDDVEVSEGTFAASSGGPLADAVVLAGVGDPSHPLHRHDAVDGVAERLLAMVRPDGRIAAWPVSLATRQDHDYLPGAVLLALASYWRTAAVVGRCLAPQLRWYRQRFGNTESWGMVGWQTQGWTSVHEHSADAEQADFVFALADWAIDRQLEKNGAFLEDLSPEEPSFNTGFIAEGIAAAWTLARRLQLADRAQRYEASFLRAARFMGGLTIRPEDTFCMRAGARAVGGVRLMQTRSDVRCDAVSHWLHALLGAVGNLPGPARR